MRVLLCLLALVVAAQAGGLSSEYLPPHQGAASAPEPVFQTSFASAPASAASYHVEASAPAPAPTYQAAPSYQPAPSYQAAQSFQSAPSYQAAQSFQSAPSYQAAPSYQPASSYQAAQSFQSAPSYQAAPSYQSAASQNFEVSASEPEPAHTFSAQEGYRYKTNRRRVFRQRRRRDVSHLASSEYLPPFQGAASAPSNDYLTPIQHAALAPQPVQYSAPAPQIEYAPEALAPAHSFSPSEGYRYKTQRRRVLRHRFRY